jgi:hypothetical protein
MAHIPGEKAPRLAVLIDAENASARIAEALFTEIATLGEASARRIYGDFSSAQLAGWTDVLARFAIQPQQNFANTKGKNSGDIALVIDGMDLLHSGRFDGFCLVSSDSDFTRLASRIREEGVDVFGFGERKTPESFRQACTRFIYTENLSGGGPAGKDRRPGWGRSGPAAAPAARKPVEAARLIEAVMADMDEDGDGWVAVGGIGNRLRNAYPDFDQRSYGLRQAVRPDPRHRPVRGPDRLGRRHAHPPQGLRATLQRRNFRPAFLLIRSRIP